MPFDVSVFRSNMTGDGARPNLFEVQLNLPASIQSLNSGNAFSNKLIFSAHSAQIPGSSISPIQINYFGRQINLAGNRTFQEWTIDIYNDEDFVVRSVLESWMGMINSHVGNVRDASMLSPNDYVADGTVYQYSKTGGTTADPIALYNIRNAWPTDLTPLQLGWDINDTVQDFTVTLAFDEWTTNNGQDFPAAS